MELGTPRHALSSRWDLLKRNKFYHSVGCVLDEHNEYCMTLRRSDLLMKIFYLMMLLYAKDSLRKSTLLSIVGMQGSPF